MKVTELLISFDNTIKDADQHPEGQAAVRTFTVYKHVLLYLIQHNKLKMSEDAQAFWTFTEQYTTGALYRVAEAERRGQHLPPLNYKQRNYHVRQNTIEEYKGSEQHHPF